MFIRYSKIIYISLFFLGIFAVYNNDFFDKSVDNSEAYILETSIIHSLENFIEYKKMEDFDLEIIDVFVNDITKPSSYFNFFKYDVDLVIKNNGGVVNNANIVISNSQEEYKYNINDLNLDENSEYIVSNYEILFPGEYNSGEVKLSLNVTNQDEVNTKNNSFNFEIFQDNAGIDISFIDFITNNYSHNFELFFSDKILLRDGNYNEVFIEDKDENLVFYTYQNTKDLIADDAWKKIKKYNQENAYFFLKSSDNNKNNFSVSNIWNIPKTEKLNRSEFAKYFIKFSDIEILDSGLNFYTDIDESNKNYKYIQTLYNLGLLDSYSTEYLPYDEMTRSEALVMIIEYFNVDFAIHDFDSFDFIDVDKDDSIYPYVLTLYSNESAKYLSEYFQADEALTKDFLIFLIDAYK